VIRPAHDDDLAGAAALLALLDPAAIVSPDALRRRIPDAFVAEVDGEVVGWAPSETGWLFVGVRPEHRRRGLGGALLARVAKRRHGERASAVALDADGVRFLEQHGFERHGTLRLAVLDLRGAILPELPDSPYRVLPLSDVRDRPAELYTLYMDTLRDVPHAGQFLEQTAGEWRTRVLDNPDLDAQISTVVLDRDEPVALAWLLSDGRRAVADYAGTAPSHRGRGLATLAKVASSRAAQAAGLESITTENDTENAPMLAINTRLGFRACGELVQFARTL
jgi:GNAT superfamily N-acetyltransferase/RimJ/RimL family protein N-acetyltransferase